MTASRKTIPSPEPKPAAAEPEADAVESVAAESVDRVAALSYNADGTVDQSPGYVVIGEDA